MAQNEYYTPIDMVVMEIDIQNALLPNYKLMSA